MPDAVGESVQNPSPDRSPDPNAVGTSGASAVPEPDLSRLTRTLSGLRAAARLRLVFQVVGGIAAGLIFYILLAGTIDFFLRMPVSVRIVLWTFAVATSASILARILPPIWRFKPSLSEIALRLERTPEGRAAGLAGVLASGLELGRRPEAASEPTSELRGQLQRMAAANALAHLATVRPSAVLMNPRRTLTVAGWLTAAAAAASALSTGWPDLAKIGAARVLTPWSSAAWPKRTMLLDASPTVAHSNAVALPLRAVVTKTPHQPGRTDVAVVYRVIVDGKAGKPIRALLTSQGAREGADLGVAADGELYERLIEPSALAAISPDRGAARVELEYSFATDDDETEPRRIAVVEPPSIRAANAKLELPEYARGVVSSESPFVTGVSELGAGTDGRAVLGPVLAGSTVRLTLELNKPVPRPAEDAPIVAMSTGQPAVFDPAQWTVTWVADASVKLSVPLRDEHGLRSTEDASFKVDVVEDRPPSGAVIAPAQDESVLATAVIEAAAEARDDIALASVRLDRQIARKPADSPGASPEAKDDPSPLAEKLAFEPGEDRTKHVVPSRLDLATLALNPGDEVRLTALATDVFVKGELRHDAVRSLPRTLRIITPSELVEQIRSELSGVREAAMRLELEQSNLNGQAARAGESPEAAAEQSPRQQAVAERLGPLNDVLNRLRQRVERNKLEDRGLSGLVEDAGSLTEAAAKSAESASEALQRLSKSEKSDPTRPDQSARLSQAQSDTAESLEQLAKMLDAGTDTWAVRRELEKLLTEQRQVQAQTATAGEAARGQSIESMDQAQRDELERIARRQQEIAQRASAALDALDQRAEQLKTADPGQAESMRQASKKAREAELESNQRQAADQIRKNQTSQAEIMQSQATAALEQMLDQLDRTQQQRDETLRRYLAEVLDLLRGLVRDQEAQLASLTKAITGGDLKGLDAGMIALNRDTEAVSDRVRSQLRQGRSVIALLESAADAQSAAITTLRSPTPDSAEADEQERQSLSRLREALAEAEKLQQNANDREVARRKAELLKAYREALEAQVTVKAETDPLVGKELGRRERAAARGLGAQQDAILKKLTELKTQTAEIGETPTFEFAHRRLDRVLTAAAGALLEGSAPASVTRDQASAISILRSLVESLKDPEKNNDFREGAQGNQAGGGGGSGGEQKLIPPAGELKLLRMMQEEAADRTRSASDAGANAPADDLDVVGTLQRELADLAKQLLDQLSNNSGPPAMDELAPDPAKPDPEVKPAPAPKPEDEKPNDAPPAGEGGSR